MRVLVNVIDEIVDVAPDLEAELSSVCLSALYAAPEMMGIWWNRTAQVLNKCALQHEKAEKIRAIFGGG